MNIALVLGLLEDLHCLFIGDVAAVVGLAAVVGKVTDADAPFALDIARAFAADALLLTAGADGNADVAFVLLQPVAQMLDGQRFALGRDSLLNGDNMHADACASGRYKLGDVCQGQVCHALEEVCGLGIHIGLLGVYHHDLCAAGNEHIQHPALFMVGVLAVEVFPVELNKAALADCLHCLFKVCSVKLRVLRGQLLDGQGNALFHGQADIEYIVRHLLIVLISGVFQCGIDAQVFRGIRGDLILSEQHCSPVGDLFAKLCDLLVFCHEFQAS